jgi:hypothetical protein
MFCRYYLVFECFCAKQRGRDSTKSLGPFDVDWKGMMLDLPQIELRIFHVHNGNALWPSDIIVIIHRDQFILPFNAVTGTWEITCS